MLLRHDAAPVHLQRCVLHRITLDMLVGSGLIWMHRSGLNKNHNVLAN